MTNFERKGDWKDFDGVCLAGPFTEMQPKIADFEVFDSDVWVCTFPKSGTTWTQEAAWLLANNLNYEEAHKLDLAQRFPNIEVSMFTYLWKYTQPLFNEEDVITYIRKIKGRRFIKTHLPFQFLPKQIQTGERKPKIIYVTRNPKDVLVSAFHHFLSSSPIKFPFEPFFACFIADLVPFCPYFDHVFGYHDRRTSHNILMVKYEDMKVNLEAEVRRLADHLEIGYKVSDEQMKKLLQHLSFDSMSKNDSVNWNKIYQPMKEDKLVAEDFAFMRSGKSQSHREMLSAAQIETMDKWIVANAEKRGLKVEELPVKTTVATY